jgi:long-subunit acyl-CoA synthetase (AMP-forming)
MFGGRLRISILGSAPIAPPVLKFYSEALGADIR